MKLGLFPDPVDGRDYLLRGLIRRKKRVDAIDYRESMLPVRDQDGEGVCAGMAGAAMKEYQEVIDCALSYSLSPRYIYHYAKKYDDLPGVEGTTLRAVMRALHDRGVCLEKTWPYIANRPGEKPERADIEAAQFKTYAYAAMLTIGDMELCLSEKGPFLLGLVVGPTWMDAGGFIPDPPTRYKSFGGHAVCACGFNRPEKRLLIKNSWGEGWGDKGYSWLSYYHVQRCFMSAWSSVDLRGTLWRLE